MTGKPLTQSRHIVDNVLGGRARAIEILQEPASLIDGWLRTDWIQGKYHRGIFLKARAAGVRINHLDFVAHLFDLPVDSSAQQQPAQ